ncbi:MAG: dihydroorotate dehydrogenase [Candidatus Asgardarchaeia archaeon]
MLSTEIGEIKLENPLILASGILGTNAQILSRLAKAGFAAVTTKSIGPFPNEGHPGPNVIEVKCGFINAIGLRNPGIDSFVKEIKLYKKLCKKPIFVSIYANDTEGYGYVARKAIKAGADALEINVSCPHSKEGVLNIGLNPKLTSEVVMTVKSESHRKPIFLKMPGNTNVPSFIDVAKAAVRAGVDGFVVANTLPAIAVDVFTKKTVLGFKIGGLSGPAIKHVTLRLVYELRKITELPIIGVGGIEKYTDVLEYMMVGANAVQVGSAVGKYGIRIVRRILKRLSKFLKEEEKSVRDYYMLAFK